MSEVNDKYLSTATSGLVLGDCLDVMSRLPSESVDLIYADPPFGNSTDKVWGLEWASLEDYLKWMQPRLREMHRVLKPTGSLYLHCDPTASHYLKVMLDVVFGVDSFANELVWAYTAPGNFQSWFPKRHDTILFYTKSPTQKKLHTFNADAIRVPTIQHSQGKKSWKEGWDNNEQESKGKLPESWWADISPVARIHNERLGYPTQKPIALLERIIRASSNLGDVILDPFCGSGTTVAAAHKLDRKYIGIDSNPEAIELSRDRLGGIG